MTKSEALKLWFFTRKGVLSHEEPNLKGFCISTVAVLVASITSLHGLPPKIHRLPYTPEQAAQPVSEGLHKE